MNYNPLPACCQERRLGIIGTKDAVNPPLLPDVTLGDLQLTRKQLFEMLRRSKMLLSMRRADAEVAKLLERRKEWNIARLPVIENNLDLFPAVKYSYSSRRPGKDDISLVVSDGGNVRLLSARKFNVHCSGVTITDRFPSC